MINKGIMFFIVLMFAVNAHAYQRCLQYPTLLEKIIETHNNTLKVTSSVQLRNIQTMLNKTAKTLSLDAANKTLIVWQCARKYNVEHNSILTIIDYSLPASKKRLWIFDLEDYKLLFHTHVSHGIASGTLQSNFFSNKYNSKASSIGIYNTEKAYRGRHGLSLKLQGLDRRFNDNAYNRFIVMHGSWYMSERFINRYGRPGRSWGCPAIPLHLTKEVIDTIKDKSFMVAYYPGNRWLLKSKFLNCDPKLSKQILKKNVESLVRDNEARGNILFADLNNNNKREESEPVVTITADDYQRIFQKTPPLKRMLRRQIKGKEYIVLNQQELSEHHNNKAVLSKIRFFFPSVKKLRGYYATEFKIHPFGAIKSITHHLDVTKLHSTTVAPYSVYFEKKSAVTLRATKRFIRWLGL